MMLLVREPVEDFLREPRVHLLVDHLDSISILIHLESKNLSYA